MKLFLTHNLDRLQGNFIRFKNEVSDMSDSFSKFIPQFQRNREGWLLAQRTLNGNKYPALSPGYAAQKLRKYGQKPILYRTGALLEAIRGKAGWMQSIGAKSMTLAISVPYASYLQDGTRKMPQRNYFLTREGNLTKMDYAQLIQAIEGDIDDDIEAILNKSGLDIAKVGV